MLHVPRCLAQTNTANTDGKIIEQTTFGLPSYDQIPAQFKSIYSRDVVEKIRNSADPELLKIKYSSDGLKISGFIYKPKNTAGKKFPAVIWNHGMVGEDSKISIGNFNDIYDMDRLLTLQAIRRGAPIKAAVVVGAPTDTVARLKENPNLEQFFRTAWPDYDKRKEEHANNRSPVLWADKINVPLLILQGGADLAVPPRYAWALAQKLDEAGNLYELIVYARDDHAVNRNAEDRLRRTIDWFKNVRKMSIAQPIGRTIKEQGIEAAIKQYHELKKNQPDPYDFGEPKLNTRSRWS